MHWRPIGDGQQTTLRIGDMLSVTLTITPRGYTIEGSHGRNIKGQANSIDGAKEAALKALRDALSSGVNAVETALRVG